jgi:hypothetical protein
MHYHCEIIMPPTYCVESAIEAIMKPFCEHDEDAPDAFWDWYVIGGRWSGTKMMAAYDEETLEAFNQWCLDEKITVSGFRCGKEDLAPADQIPKVDAKWNEMFPSPTGSPIPCPIFRHSNKGELQLPGDTCQLKDATNLSCERIIFAAPGYNAESSSYTGPLKATFMLSRSFWNGVTWQDASWDGTLESAMALFKKHSETYKDEYRKLITPGDDWTTVTVDYHT